MRRLCLLLPSGSDLHFLASSAAFRFEEEEDEQDDEGEEEEGGDDGGDDPNGDDPVVEPRIDDGFDARPQASNDGEDFEAATYKCKDLKDLKMPQVPKDSVGFRLWRNALLTQYSAIDRTGKARILRWLQVCMGPEVTNREIAQLQNDPEQLPRLDSFLASQISDAKYMKGEFGLEVQAYIERAHAHGVLPSGRAMLAMLSRRFRVDRLRGVTVTQQTLLAVTLDGFSYNQMQTFKERVEYILNGIAPEHWPSDATLFSWFYANIKTPRGMQRIIDKIKDSAPTSRRRTFGWLREQFSDHLAELREDANERDFREAMLKETEGKGNKTTAKPKGHDASAKTKSNATAVPAKDTAVPAAPGKPPKGTPKGNKAKAKSKAKAKGGAKGDGSGNDTMIKVKVKAKAKAIMIQRVHRQRRMRAPRLKLPCHACSSQRVHAIGARTVSAVSQEKKNVLAQELLDLCVHQEAFVVQYKQRLNCVADVLGELNLERTHRLLQTAPVTNFISEKSCAGSHTRRATNHGMQPKHPTLAAQHVSAESKAILDTSQFGKQRTTQCKRRAGSRRMQTAGRLGAISSGSTCAPIRHWLIAGGSSKSKGASVSSAAVAMLLPTTAAGRAVEDATRVGKAAARGSYNSLLRIGFNAVCKVLAAFATFVCSLIAHETWASQSLAAPAILSLPAGVQRSSGSGYKLDWIADSGAGRSLTSFESLKAQGVYPDDLVCHEDEPVSFETGNGRTESSSINTIGAIFGPHKSYVLNSCPTVRSMGEIMNQGFAFTWLPHELSFFVPKDALQMTADGSRVHKASMVEGDAPIFSEDVQFAMPAQKKLMHDSARSSKKSKDITLNAGSRDIFFDPGVPSPSAAGSRDPDPTVEVEEPKASAEDPDQIMPPQPLPPPAKPPGDGALADSERESSEDDGLAKHRKLVKEAQSLEHSRLSHFPKNPACPTCQRSRMYRKRVAARRADPLADRGMLPEVMQFGERVATDFIIVRKLKDGKENATQVVRGEYSGWARAYPVAKRDTDTVSRNLLLFLGPAYDRTTVICKSDQAIEILAACKCLGVVHEDTLDSRFPHNSQLERDIRTIEEIARATHLGAGLRSCPINTMRPQCCPHNILPLAKNKHAIALQSALSLLDVNCCWDN